MGNIYSPNLIIPNGALINDVCHIYQSTKPTTRPDESSLMLNDRWTDVTDGSEWYYDGVLWKSVQTYILSDYNKSTAISANLGLSLLPAPLIHFSYESLDISFYNSGLNNASNYWRFYSKVLFSNGYLQENINQYYADSVDSSAASGEFYFLSKTVNTVLSYSNLLIGFEINVVKVGSPGDIARCKATINLKKWR
jgi:hypothetical protein